MPKESCSNCKFFADTGGNEGLCRLHPPRVFEVHILAIAVERTNRAATMMHGEVDPQEIERALLDTDNLFYPMVQSAEWCGQWKPAAKYAPEEPTRFLNPNPLDEVR